MKKNLVTMMALALTIGAQAQNDDGMDAMLAAMIAAKIHQDSIDTSNLVAVYDYECQTQDADGKAVTDRMKLCLQVGTAHAAIPIGSSAKIRRAMKVWHPTICPC